MRSAIAPGVQLLVNKIGAHTFEIILRTPAGVMFKKVVIWEPEGPSLDCAADIAYGNEPFEEPWPNHVTQFLRDVARRDNVNALATSIRRLA